MSLGKTPDENRVLRSTFLDEIKPLLEKHNIDFNSFAPKALYEDESNIYIRLYQVELTKESDKFIEIVTTDYKPVLNSNNARTIYKWKYTKHYEEEYRRDSLLAGIAYLIPFEELDIIFEEKIPKGKLTTDSVSTLENATKRSLNTDAPYSQLTIRDYFAIHHLKPVSHKQWLNDLILKNI